MGGIQERHGLDNKKKRISQQGEKHTISIIGSNTRISLSAVWLN
jgi:hypothetical protein